MNQLSECKVCRKLTSLCSAISKYHFREDFDVTLGIYADETAENPEKAYHLKGKSRVNLLKLFGLMGLCAVVLSLIIGVCRRLRSL